MSHTIRTSLPQYFRQNILLLFSTAAALGLFLTVSKLSILLCAAIFLAVAATAWILGPAEANKQPAGAHLLAVVLDGIGAATFYDTWTQSYMAGVILDRLPISLRPFLPAVCAVLVLSAYYAFYRLSGWMIRVIRRFAQTSDTGTFLAKNWIFPISAAAFFLLEPSLSREQLCGAAAAAAIALAAALHIPRLCSQCRDSHWGWNLTVLLSAVGICKFRLDQTASAPTLLLMLWAAAGIPFVFVCLSWFFRSLSAFCIRQKVFAGLGRKEAGFYILLWIILLLFTGWVYQNTSVFALEADPYDILYTGDFPLLVNENVCLDLANAENDLRQPLFAVFAAPFTAIPYLISSLLSAGPQLHALLMNSTQIAVMLFASFLLAGLLDLSGTGRMLFLLLTCCTYPTILFSLMMEQYIFAYFFIILFFYSFCQTGRGCALSFLGAGGTLLTGVVLLPLTSQHHPLRQFKPWFRDMLDQAMAFVLVLLAFSRADVIFNIASNVEKLTAFSGAKVTMQSKLMQYTAFVSSCFVSPAASITENPWGNPSWQLVPAESFHTGGILILILCAVSAFWNRKRPSSWACAGWITFSFAVLVLLGWGTQENGLILYALYFGWAFWVLLYQLVEALCASLRRPRLLPVLTIGAAGILLFVNLPAMGRMVHFLVTHYPA